MPLMKGSETQQVGRRARRSDGTFGPPRQGRRVVRAHVEVGLVNRGGLGEDVRVSNRGRELEI